LLEGVDLSLDLEGKRVLDGLALCVLLTGSLVGHEDLHHLSERLLGSGRQGSGDLGTGLIRVSLQMLGELLESLDDLGNGEDSDLVGELGLVVLDLGLHFGGESLLEGQDLVVLLTWSLVGDEDLDDVSSGLLGSGRELEHAGLSLLGVSLQMVGQTVELVDVVIVGVGVGEVVEGSDSESLGELLLVGIDLSQDGRGEGLADLLDLGVLLLGGLVGAEDLDDLSGGLLGGLRQLGDSGASLLGVCL
ncbi:hypothetical protein PMAYCL1PPCAC_01884, partial [Pristionchus mayeri]